MRLSLHAEDLSGPAAGTPLQPATGGGPGLVSGSYGSANAPANSGVSVALPFRLASFCGQLQKGSTTNDAATLVNHWVDAPVCLLHCNGFGSGMQHCLTDLVT